MLYNEVKDIASPMYDLLKTHEFEDGYNDQPLKTKFQIDDRLSHIVKNGHFGTRKDLREEIWELKWKNGRRIYFAYLAKYELLLLLGGNKNGQNKDVKQAQKIFRKYVEEDLSP